MITHTPPLLSKGDLMMAIRSILETGHGPEGDCLEWGPFPEGDPAGYNLT